MAFSMVCVTFIYSEITYRKPNRILQLLQANWSNFPLLPFIHDLHILVFQKAAHLRFTSEDSRDQVASDLLLFLLARSSVPFLQSKFALTAEQQHELKLK